MFALGIRYLNGWSMAAADGAAKQQAEWPPHPDRVFMALAAAWFETGQETDEGEALRWLETLPSPSIAASGRSLRTLVTSFVPVNDDGGGWKGKHPKKGKSIEAELQRLKKRGLAVVPEHRSRQPRSFPVAIPHDPTVRLIWEDEQLGGYGDILERLTAKVTHIGHSATFVQMWLERESLAEPTLTPTNGIAAQRLRVPWPGRLDRLTHAGSRRSWIAYQDLGGKIERAKADLKTMKQPPRVPWTEFPDVVLLTEERDTKAHPDYDRAKSGDGAAATRLVESLLDDEKIASVRTLIAESSVPGGLGIPTLIGVHAYETGGVNAIPVALARLLSLELGIPHGEGVVQTNIVAHTGADGYSRLARQAAFYGPVTRDTEYVMVDDFVGQGGTLANLRGWIAKKGGNVIGAVALAGRWYSTRLTPSKEQLHELRKKHGSRLEKWWKEYFGHTFDCLTHSEARYLARSPDVDTIRDRLAAVQPTGDRPGSWRSPRAQRRYIRDLTAEKRERFPALPRMPRRPQPGKWQGYARAWKDSAVVARGTIFDPHIIVLRITGQRLPLSATLKATGALRGLLMLKCPKQPPPEWFSGHRTSGGPSTMPHLALVPLPFVGSRHADGAIMGLGLALPRDLDPLEAGRCLEPILRDQNTGLPRRHGLFNGQWLECHVEIDAGDHRPKNLDPDTWTGGQTGSRVWATVTPLVLNRHFKGKDKWRRAAESVKEACKHVGLPPPGEVFLHPVSPVQGVAHARGFPRITRKGDGGRRSHSHAKIVFDRPVRGPVIVGAGRFRGYGLCRPMGENGRDQWATEPPSTERQS